VMSRRSVSPGMAVPPAWLDDPDAPYPTAPPAPAGARWRRRLRSPGARNGAPTRPPGPAGDPSEQLGRRRVGPGPGRPAQLDHRRAVGTVEAEIGLLAEGHGPLEAPGPGRTVTVDGGEGEALVGLQVVVVVTEPGQVVERGRATVCEGDHVVDLETGPRGASGHHTNRVAHHEGVAQ